ncbi:hypothetical protein [Streptomyces lancefieldiae]|uniref:Uncharacterized protein n=1 Tax=Streptomyces lancefieldiae TaxID=3075520 RepID=A0ABU3AYI2_9ACTN|nr:hypothetical protein [Streptomyces sp. DSM 40712]MDT0615251.1 hypothetical protein [Streptomyces sp. DSM 40712]
MNESLKDEVLGLVDEYDQTAGSAAYTWVADESRVLASGTVLTAEDRMALVEAALDLRIASGHDPAAVTRPGRSVTGCATGAATLRPSRSGARARVAFQHIRDGVDGLTRDDWDRP